MPGAITSKTINQIQGWVVHPRQQGFCPTVNLIYGTRVFQTAVADRSVSEASKNSDLPSEGYAFTFDLAEYCFRKTDLAELRVLVGETGEWILQTSSATREQKPALTVRDLILMDDEKRWVTGETYVDAIQAGLSFEVITDMLYRDFLGRPADPEGLSSYSQMVKQRRITFDDVRRALISSGEFARRKIEAQEAPGAIFSKRIIFHAVQLPAVEESAGHDQIVDVDIQQPSLELTVANASGSQLGINYDLASRLDGEAAQVLVLQSGDPAFIDGWHIAEADEISGCHWMSERAALQLPLIGTRINRVDLLIGAVFGSATPNLEAWFDGSPTKVTYEAVSPTEFVLHIRPYTEDVGFGIGDVLELQSRTFGNPAQEGISSDDRNLSILVRAVLIVRADTCETSVGAPLNRHPDYEAVNSYAR